MEVTNDIKEIASKIAWLYKDKIEQASATASLQLWDFTWDVEIEGASLSIYFNLPVSENGFPYWKAVENGTKPHWVPIEAIRQWITVKPIHPVPKADGTVPTTEQLAYAIQWKIAKQGTPARHLLSEALNEADTYIDEIVDLIAQQAQEEINKEIDNSI